MGMIDRFLNAGPAAAIGNAATGMAEIFHVNATRRMELDEAAHAAALAQMAAEFAGRGDGWFDEFVNGLNRLPRPLMTLGTLGLFGYAMAAPEGFGRRMEGLAHVPEPLWWLLGAVVSFYFGAREAHYFRTRQAFGPLLRQIAARGGATASPAQGTDDHAAGTAALDQALQQALSGLPDGVSAPPWNPAEPAEIAGQKAPAMMAGPPEDFPRNAALREWAASRQKTATTPHPGGHAASA